ncbi:unnamed protein product, partial [marine sediment metagenome]
RGSLRQRENKDSFNISVVIVDKNLINGSFRYLVYDLNIYPVVFDG